MAGLNGLGGGRGLGLSGLGGGGGPACLGLGLNLLPPPLRNPSGRPPAGLKKYNEALIFSVLIAYKVRVRRDQD